MADESMILQFVDGRLKFDLSSDPHVGPETAKIILMAQVVESLGRIENLLLNSDVEWDTRMKHLMSEMSNIGG